MREHWSKNPVKVVAVYLSPGLSHVVLNRFPLHRRGQRRVDHLDRLVDERDVELDVLGSLCIRLLALLQALQTFQPRGGGGEGREEPRDVRL